MFRGEVGNESFALLLALQSAGEDGKFSFRVNNGRLEKIADLDGRWSVYKNGKLLSEPVDKLTITGGDRYSLRIDN